VVPYGVDAGAGVPAREDHAGPLRVLTAGIVGLRKGSPYVQAAAQAMKGVARFRMVGPAPLKAQALEPLRRDVELVGAVPRPDMAAHYAWADVFLLPRCAKAPPRLATRPWRRDCP
jgi:glycosyltransferase involved in cell wall biosynthesis